MIIFLAGLQGVPLELHEAAMMDGAGVLSRFFNVTLPMITPTIFFNDRKYDGPIAVKYVEAGIEEELAANR